MKLVVKLFGILMLLLGILLIIKPDFIFGFMENNMDNTSLYIFAIVVRLVLGIIFIVAAKASKYPGVIKFLGYLFLAAASLLIFMGQENFQHFINSVIPNLRPFVALIGLLSMAFGGFLIYAFQGKKIRAGVN